MVADNRALNAAEIRQHQTRLSSTPLQVNVDLTGICNINPPCVFCSGKNVGYNYAPLDVARLDAYAPYLERCERINDDSFGEPLSHPALAAFGKRFTSEGQRFTFVSNGLLLTPAKAHELAELGVNLGLHISFNAATAETFYHLTGKSFELLVENVRRFVRIFRERNGDRPDLTLTFIVMRMNCHEVPAFIRLAADLECHALLASLHDRPSTPLGKFGYDFVYDREILPFAELEAIGADVRPLAASLGVILLLQWNEAADSALRGHAEPDVDVPCLIPFRFLHLQNHSGKVYGCPYHTRPLGDLAEAPVEDIWNGAVIREIRESLLGGEVAKFCWNNSAACPVIGRLRSERAEHPVTSDIVMGESDRLELVEGWHRLEEIPEQARWTSKRAVFVIGAHHHATLCIRCQSFRPDLDRHPTCGSVAVDDVPVGRFRLGEPGWHELRFPLPADGTTAGTSDRRLTGSIVTDNPWVPAGVLRSSAFEAVIGRRRMISGSRDTRELGIVVQRIWME